MINDDVKNIIRETAKEAVTETLTGLGFDTKEIHETQADMLYLRQLRKGSYEMSQRVKGAFVAVSVSTVLYLVWQAIKQEIFK